MRLTVIGAPVQSKRVIVCLQGSDAVSDAQGSRLRDASPSAPRLARRSVVSLLPAFLLWTESPGSDANVLEDVTRGVMRPDLEFQQALVILLDARSVLREIQLVAATPERSAERRELNPRLPGMARRLRMVGEATPVVAAVVSGKDKEQSVSSVYGGFGKEEDTLMVDGVYAAIGSVLTYSGRAIQPELIEKKSLVVDDAIQTISNVLEQVPEVEIEAAQTIRKNR